MSKKLPLGPIKTVVISSLGGMLEFYDFIIFVYFTEAIGKSFFPADVSPWLRQLEVFALFAAGYLARPIGGVVMAHFGDRSGRKRVFALSVLMMAVPTLVIGCLPTYATIGYAAPLSLLACRILQGAAVGGEVPGAWVFVSEHAPPSRTGLACGLLTAGLTAGIMLGSVVNLVIAQAFTPAQVITWAWRLPFLLGGVIGLIGITQRRQLSETPTFEALKAEAQFSDELPLKELLRDHWCSVLLSMMATWLLTAVIVVLVLLAPSLFHAASHISPKLFATAGFFETAALAVGCVCWGTAIDRFGLRMVAAIAMPVIVGAAVLLFAWPTTSPALVIVFALVGAAAGLIAIVPVTMVRAFPPRLAFSGVSTSYNGAYALAGGLTPPLAAWLFHLTPLALAGYVAVVALLSTGAILWAGRAMSIDRSEPVPHERERLAAIGRI